MRALMASLLLHGLLVAGRFAVVPLSWLMPPTALNVVLREAQPRGERGVPLSVRSSQASSLKRSSNVVVSEQVRSMVGRPATASRSPAVVATSVSGPPATAAPLGGELGLRASVNTAPREGVSADALRQYRMALAIGTRRFNRYPLAAREQGLEGGVEVAVQLMATGLVSVVLSKSSGYVELDAQAVEMVGRAARSVPLPDGLHGQALRVVLPVQFSLTGE